MNKKGLKSIIIILILFLVGVGAVLGINTAKTYLSGAAAGEKPTGVRVQAERTSATITWQSDKETMGVVEYGTNQASLLLRAQETQPTTIHRVVLSPLKEGTTYYFRIRIGETIYDNNGIPYSFKTKTAGEEKRGEEMVPSPSPSPSPTPTVVSPTATPTAAQSKLVTQCRQSEFESKFGTNDPAYDFDKNGVVNTRDWLLCRQQNQ